MSISIGRFRFDDVAYDEGADVLYLSVDGPVAVPGERTPEGHVLFADEDDPEWLHGITLISPRYLREAEGSVRITLPDGEHRISGEELDLALGVLA